MEIPLLHRQFVGKFHPQKKMYALGTLLVLLVISLYYLLVITYVFPNLLNYVSYALTCLRVFALYVPCSSALSTRLARPFQMPCTPCLCALKSF